MVGGREAAIREGTTGAAKGKIGGGSCKVKRREKVCMNGVYRVAVACRRI